MKRILLSLGICCLCGLLWGQVGRVGINTGSPVAMLHVMDSSVAFTGPSDLPFMPGPPPVTGAGTRMMWYPEKAAFRVGGVTGQHWAKDSIGTHSFAAGRDTRAIGHASLAIGAVSRASGAYSVVLGVENNATGAQSAAIGSFLTASGTWATALGIQSIASGDASTAIGYSFATGDNTTAIGYQALASGYQAVAMGYSALASGDQAVAIGRSTATGASSFSAGHGSIAQGFRTVALGNTCTAKSFGSVSIGSFNDTTAISTTQWELTDPLFIIGNGTNHFDRQNAMTVLKNGKTGIGDLSPNAKLHVSDGSGGNQYATECKLIIEDNEDTYLQFSTLTPRDAGILSGNQVSAVRSALIFQQDSSVQIRAGGNQTKLTVLKNGNTGIGTLLPQKLLHLSGGSSGASATSSALAVLEDNSDVSINLITPAADESAIYFGNPANAQQGGIVYNAINANELSFRTNGNTTRAVITSTGFMGIAENSPDARLHVSNGVNSGMYHTESDIIIEDDNNSYIQFSNPTGFANGLLSGTNATDIRSALLFLADSSLVLRTGGNNTRLTIDKTGNSSFIGEIRRSATGAANMVPICYGSVDLDGDILSGSGNFSVTPMSPGQYNIVITNETYTNTGYTTTATPVSSNPRLISIGGSGGELIVKTYNSSGTLTDCIFHFVVYKS